jgi:N-acyl-D-amino-acid deacylase
MALLSHAHAADPTGPALPGMAPFDEAMTYIVEKWQIPGAGLAVAKDGRLLLARGYGFANKEREEPVQPTHLFRLGSMTKTVTAVAILKLVEDGKLKLDDKVLPILGDLGPRPDKISDPRVKDITVRHLLQHGGGWDRAKSGDPIGPKYAQQAALRQGASLPPTCLMLMRDAFEIQLDFAPGERQAYSNIGYCTLGRVVEKVSGIPYEQFVRQRIFDQVPIRALQWGKSLETAQNEVTYYDYPDAPRVTAMGGVAKGLVAAPYGYLWLESMDAFGSLIGAPVDYLKFLLAIDGRVGPALLKRASIQEMLARPSYPAAKNAATYRALGVEVRPFANGANVWHGGTQPGMSALGLRNNDGSSWVVAFNSLPKDRGAFANEYDRQLQTARERMRGWPSGNLFPQFP